MPANFRFHMAWKSVVNCRAKPIGCSAIALVIGDTWLLYLVLSMPKPSYAVCLVHHIWMTPAGFEPAIPGSVGRCLIHWATGPLSARHRISDPEVTHLGGRKGRAVGLKPALPGSLGRCLVHWAAGPLAERIRISNHGSDLPGWRQRPSMRVTPPHDGA